MADKIKLVRGDTLPQPKAILTDSVTALPVDLAGSTCVMFFRAVGSSTTLSTVPGTLLTGLEAADGTVDTTAPYNVAGKGGRVVFVWDGDDLNVAAGDYEGEIQVTFSGGAVQSVWDVIKFKVREQFA